MNNLFICRECGKKFSTFCWLTRHVNKEHDSYKSYFLKHEEPEFHKCPYCDNERRWVGASFYPTCGSKECITAYRIDCAKNIDWNARNVKSKITYKLRTGYESPAHNPEIIEKKKQTCLEKYGTEYSFNAESVKDKIKESIIKKYGCENPSQAEEVKEKKKATFQERYGVDYYSQTSEWNDKTKQTNLDNYGKEWAPQSSKFMRNVRHKFVNEEGISFASKPEMKVYEFCKKMGYDIVYQPKSIKYIDLEGKQHYYQPDFMINGKLFEVKGDYMWKDGHLYNPYRRTSDKNFTVEHKNMITACKDRCMKEHGVTVILQSQITSEDLQRIIENKL